MKVILLMVNMNEKEKNIMQNVNMKVILLMEKKMEMRNIFMKVAIVSLVYLKFQLKREGKIFYKNEI